MSEGDDILHYLKNLNKTGKALARSANKKFFEKHKNKHIHKRQVLAATTFLLAILTLPMFSVSFGAKEISLTVDGKTYTETTHKATTDAFVNEIKSEHDLEGYKVNSSDSKILKNDSTIELHSKKTVNVTKKGKTKHYTTYQDTVEEFLKEQELDNNDLTLSGANDNTLLVDDNSFSLDSHSSKNKTEKEKIILPTKYVDNDNLAYGKKVTKTEGTPKVVQNTYKIDYENGKQVNKKLVSSKTINQGTQKVVEVGTKVAPTKTKTVPTKRPSTNVSTSDSGSGNWEKIASCESGGNWSMNTGNGYYGGLQISKGTWDANKGAAGVSADYPYQASKEEQIAVAEHIQQTAGWSQWGACASQAGLA